MKITRRQLRKLILQEMKSNLNTKLIKIHPQSKMPQFDQVLRNDPYETYQDDGDRKITPDKSYLSHRRHDYLAINIYGITEDAQFVEVGDRVINLSPDVEPDFKEGVVVDIYDPSKDPTSMSTGVMLTVEFPGGVKRQYAHTLHKVPTLGEYL